MATKTIVSCDVCGKQPAATAPLVVGGTTGEVDLCERHAKALNAAVQPFMTAARITGGRRRVVAAKKTAKKAPAKRSAKKPVSKKAAARRTKASSNVAAIRAWAQESGVEVATRGRLKPELVAAYNAARKTSARKAK